MPATLVSKGIFYTKKLFSSGYPRENGEQEFPFVPLQFTTVSRGLISLEATFAQLVDVCQVADESRQIFLQLPEMPPNVGRDSRPLVVKRQGQPHFIWREAPMSQRLTKGARAIIYVLTRNGMNHREFSQELGVTVEGDASNGADGTRRHGCRSGKSGKQGCRVG